MSDYKKGEIVIYKGQDGHASLEVKLQDETVWLTQKQMSLLFQKVVPTINEHIKNVYDEGELVKRATIRKFRIVQMEGNRQVDRIIDHYNLDVIISVGYRVKSKRGTQFRIWANRILKEYIIQGYALNENRLQEQVHKFKDLQRSIKLIGKVSQRKPLSSTEAEGLIQLVSEYAYALDVLDQYDKNTLKVKDTSKKKIKKVTYSEARKTVDELKEKLDGSDIFGKEKDQSFHGSLNAIYQTIEGKDCYPSIEEKAAHLLYFIVKNHSFVDGNKRIAAFIFIWFLERNGILYKKDRSKLLADNALVALTLLIATSNPDDKDIIIKVIVNLINKNN
jgi:prophage maintenance system killer protein